LYTVIQATKFEEKAGCFVITIYKAQDKAQVDLNELNPTEQQILEALHNETKTSKQLLEALGYNSKAGNFKRAITHLLELEYIQMTKPQQPTARNQAYKVSTEKF
jgi:ATP-dependent DNA helicase RecG